MEALMLNHKGEVAECTGDNIFVVQHGRIHTPSIDSGILEGITRDAVIELAQTAGIHRDRADDGPARRVQRRRMLPHGYGRRS